MTEKNPTPIVITCPPELAGILTQFAALPAGAARAHAASTLYATMGTLATLASLPASRPRVPLTEAQQAVYDMIEERGVVKLDDLVAHLSRLGVDVDRNTVQRWCGPNVDKPGPLHKAGVRSGRKGYHLSRVADTTPTAASALTHKPHPADVIILGLIELEGPQTRDSIVGQIEGEPYKSRGNTKQLTASTAKRRVDILVASEVLASTAAGYIIADETASKNIQSVEFFK